MSAIRKQQSQFVVEVSHPSVVAIRPPPSHRPRPDRGCNRAMIRLEDPLFVNRSIHGFQFAAGMALGGSRSHLGSWRAWPGPSGARRRNVSNCGRSFDDRNVWRRAWQAARRGRPRSPQPTDGNPVDRSALAARIGPDDESFEGLVEEVDRLEGIVARLLQFSRADAQDLLPSNLNHVISEVARLTLSQADGQEVQIKLDLDPELPNILMAPPRSFRCSGTCQSTHSRRCPTGEHFSFQPGPTRSRVLSKPRFQIQGPGLDPGSAAHLFEPFYTHEGRRDWLGTRDRPRNRAWPTAATSGPRLMSWEGAVRFDAADSDAKSPGDGFDG